MDRNEGESIVSNPYEAMYTAEITNGYLTLPVECIKDIDLGSLIMTLSWKEGVVCLYTSEAFDEVRHNLGLLNVMDSNARALKRRVIGSAEEINANDGSKILINTEFLNELGFDIDQEKTNKETFNVVILKHSYVIEILSGSLFEELYG